MYANELLKSKTDLKEQKIINSTLRYMLFLTLCLFVSSLYYNGVQLRLNQVLRTDTETVYIKSSKVLNYLEKYKAILMFRRLDKKEQNKKIRSDFKKRIKNGKNENKN